MTLPKEINIDKLSEMIEGYLPSYFDEHDIPQVGHNKPPLPVVEQENIASQFKTVKELLNGLDEVFNNLKKLKPRYSNHAQRVAKKFGPYIIDLASEKDEISPDGIGSNFLESGFKAFGLPGYLVGYNHTRPGPDITNQFFIAIKTKSLHPLLKRKGCVYYEVTRLFLTKERKVPFELLYYIEVQEKTGEVRVVKTNNADSKFIPAKQLAAKRKGGNRLAVRRIWSYPDHRDPKNEEQMKATPEVHLANTFCIEYNCIMRREFGINILVKKDGYRATFTIQQNQWKSFFTNRITAKTPTGRTKPIFHCVVSHMRETKKGIVPVKNHYRGERHFFWNEYEIKIIVPGKHGLPQASFDVPAVFGYSKDSKRDLVDIEDIAGDINKAFEGRS